MDLEWIERFHDWRAAHKWMADHYEVPVALCVVYLVAIFAIQKIMTNRKAFGLDTPLFLWNVLLALFSIFGALNTVPSIARVVMAKGVQSDMCSIESEGVNPWVYLFCLSKIPELMDTIFIVLRKRPLIFLHYYHHVMTLLYCWNAWALQTPNGGWFAAMNLCIHSLMYSYYAACAYGARFSNLTRLSITSLQILQMVLGVLIVLHNMVYCNTHPENYIFALVMYASYMALFVKLFMDSYVGKRERKPATTKKSQYEKVKDEQEQVDVNAKKSKKLD